MYIKDGRIKINRPFIREAPRQGPVNCSLSRFTEPSDGVKWQRVSKELELGARITDYLVSGGELWAGSRLVSAP